HLFFSIITSPTSIYTLSLHDALPISCFWGILLRGAIVVPMDPTASPDFVGRAIQDASVKLIVRDGQLADPVLAPPSLVINGRKEDRKSTRLNSSHDQISYAVFCLKKK